MKRLRCERQITPHSSSSKRTHALRRTDTCTLKRVYVCMSVCVCLSVLIIGRNHNASRRLDVVVAASEDVPVAAAGGAALLERSLVAARLMMVLSCASPPPSPTLSPIRLSFVEDAVSPVSV